MFNVLQTISEKWQPVYPKAYDDIHNPQDI